MKILQVRNVVLEVTLLVNIEVYIHDLEHVESRVFRDGSEVIKQDLVNMNCNKTVDFTHDKLTGLPSNGKTTVIDNKMD